MQSTYCSSVRFFAVRIFCYGSYGYYSYLVQFLLQLMVLLQFNEVAEAFTIEILYMGKGLLQP